MTNDDFYKFKFVYDLFLFSTTWLKKDYPLCLEHQ